MMRVIVDKNEVWSFQQKIEPTFGAAESAKLGWKPNSPVPVADEAVARDLFKLIEALEENDDIQNVYANYEIPDDLMQKLAA